LLTSGGMGGLGLRSRKVKEKVREAA
jgi:hypothetical protein